MNLAARRLFVFFFSLAILASCEDPTDIGIELQDENQIGTDYTDTITINTGTVLLNDSIVSYKVSPVLVGAYADPVLGSIKASAFTEVSLGGTNVKFGDNPVADSLVLTLDYNAIYGDRTKPLTVNVHRLTEGFDEKSSYFTNSSLAYEATPLGSATVMPKLYEKAKTFEDSTAARNLVKVRISADFMNQLVAQSGQAPLATQQAFTNFLRGLAIVPVNEPASALALNMTSDSTKLVLHYRNGADKKKHTFGLARTSSIDYFTRIEADRTGSAVAELNEKGDFVPSSQTGGESYVQSNTQLLTKLTFPYLQQFKEASGNIIINRAQLIVPVKPSTSSNIAPPPQLVAYQTNNSNMILRSRSGAPLAVQQNRVGAVESTAFPSALIYDPKRSHYTLDMTAHFQAMVLGQKPNQGLLLAPASVVAASSGALQIVQDTRPYRAILSNTEANQVKLVLYYSKLN
ncbi:MAG: DUF4270 domain-containing protein [Hymenobacteraceae bacterium]|nr:DUF4270 domain-containing protein [Hymenobacteraceae bacterium]MDX5483212.1 DUF4270 domain-containing protein [Hymenobacteraceae bacterium]